MVDDEIELKRSVVVWWSKKKKTMLGKVVYILGGVVLATVNGRA